MHDRQDEAGLQWERTQLSWARTIASFTSLMAVAVTALVHVQASVLPDMVFVTITGTATLLLSAVCLAHLVRVPTSTSSWHALMALCIGLVSLAGLGLAVGAA